jgi:fermentation-respiration switch protein FrsA (DUF1100 family)
MRKALVFLLSALFLLAAGSAWLALYPTVPADLGGAEDLDAQARHVQITVGENDHLDGWYLRGNKPAVVLLFAGYARDHRRMWRYGGFLHRLGFNVLTVDFRSARAVSRKPTTLGYWEVRDARAALDWARAQPELEHARVALFGESLGGAAALALAAERSDVTAVVADCPFASGDLAIADGFQCVLHLPAVPLAWIARQVGRLVTGHDPGELDVTQALRTLAGRLDASLGIYGERWTLDDVKHTEAWLDHRAEYERRVGDFLTKRLGVAAATKPAAPQPAPAKRKP